MGDEAGVGGGGRKEEMGQVWTLVLARRACADGRKVLASAGSREEVGSLAFSLPFSGFPGRNFWGKASDVG